MTDTAKWLNYPEIDAPESLEHHVLDVIRLPIDGNHDDESLNAQLMKTEVAKLTVQAAFLVKSTEASAEDSFPIIEQEPHPRVVVHFAETAVAEYSDAKKIKKIGGKFVAWGKVKKQEKVEEMVFALKPQDDGGFGVATVAGSTKGYAELSAEMSQEVSNLLAQSIDAGEELL